MPEESTAHDLAAITREVISADSYEQMIALMEPYYASEAVWDLGQAGLGPFESSEAIRAFLKECWPMWEDHHHYVESLLDLGHGVVFVVVREDGRVKGSDARVEARSGWVIEWVEGLIVRVRTGYTDLDEARAAAERLAESRG